MPTFVTVIAWSYGLAGLGYAAFAVRLAFARRRDLREWAMLAAMGFGSAWGLLAVASALRDDPMLLWGSAIADVLRLGGWYAFLLSLTERMRTRAGAGEANRVAWLLPVAGAVVAWGLAVQLAVPLRLSWVGDLGRLSLYDALAGAVLGLVVLEQLFRNAAEDSRWSITPLCLGLAAPFVYDVYLYSGALLFNRMDADLWSARGFVHALSLPLVALSIARNRGTAFRLAFSRQVMFRSAALVMSGVYLIFMAAAGYYVRYFGGEWGRALQVALLSAGLVLLGLIALSGSMRAKLRVLVSKHFFSYRYDYRDEWLRFTQALSSAEGQTGVAQQVIKGLADLVESPGGELWMRDLAGRTFTPSARWNMIVSSGVEDVQGPLARFLAESGWVVNLEEFRSAPDRYGDLTLPDWLSELPSAWLVVPLAAGQELTGFVVLATARTPVEVNWEVTDLLKVAGRQAASFLAQMQATEALLESRKFDAFNRMSAFVVHDLKNIVAQLSLMVRNAERHRNNPEFQEDMLMTVEHSVERMKQLMMQLREGTTPADVAHRVDLAEAIDRIARAKSAQEVRPEVEIDERVATKGHADRLERVIGHLVQNALDATAKGGRVWIKLSRQGQHAMVEVGDTGHGMTPEFVRERLFKPFQTTKQTGMGIGAYESHQYVQELGGRVLVDSTPNVGTRVRLLLPLFEGLADAVQAPQRDVA